MSGVGLITPEWDAPSRVRAVMTTRVGGVSGAPWDSLNLGLHVGDRPAAVLENRRRVREEGRLPAEPVWLTQVHGTDVLDLGTVDGAASLLLPPSPQVPGGVASPPREGLSEPPRADAAVTRRVGTVCAIMVADCMPVLFAARDGSVVGAAHAGWRGLAGGVLAKTVSAMGLAGRDIVAWLGPAIGPDHFEVGDDVVDAFVRSASLADKSPTEAAFTRNTRGKWLCDLYALARLRLASLGITEVTGGGSCTVAEPHRFFSYRRDGQTGRMAALIWLEPGRA